MAGRAILKVTSYRTCFLAIFDLKWLMLIICGYLFYFTLTVHETNLLVWWSESVTQHANETVVRLMKSLAQHSQSQTVMNQTGRTTKDIFHVVTAASSKEFESLLKLIHSITKSKVSITLWLWSLDLSSCEISYIKSLNTPFEINIEIFPFHIYPLHVRQFHLLAIKPIVLEIAALAFGHALWMDPNSVLTGNIAPMVGKLSQTGYIIDSGRTNFIGISYYKFETFRKNWVKCVKRASCLKTYTNKTNHKEEDQALRYFMSQNKMLSSSFKDVLARGSTRNDFNKFRDNWRESVSKRCSKHKVFNISFFLKIMKFE